MPTSENNTPAQNEKSLGGFLRWSAMTLFCGAVLLGTARRAAAATVTVTSAADSGAGTLRSALAAANPGDTINFSLPKGSLINLATPLVITKSVSITGPGASQLTVIPASGNYSRLITVDDGTAGSINVSISALRLANATYRGGIGAGIYNKNENLTLSNVSIYNCNATFQVSGGYGGAIASQGGSVLIQNSYISNCYAKYGGGGIYNNTGSLTITNSTIARCYSKYNGSGIGSYASAVTIQNSTISSNRGRNNDAGGLRLASSVALIQNSTIAYNRSRYGGGGIYNNASTVTLQSTVVSGNKVNGVYNDVYNNGTLNVSNSLLRTVPTGAGVIGTNIANYSGAANLTYLQFNGGPTLTNAPTPGSLALGHGSNPAGLTTDQRGAPRTVAGKVDIGAVQIQPAQSLVVTNANDSGTGSLRAAAASVFDTPSTITFDPTYFTAATPRTIPVLNNAIVVNGPVTITGPGEAVATVDGGNTTRVLNIQLAPTTNVSISGLTLAHGSVASGSYFYGYGYGYGANFGGGGIFASAALTLDHVTISGCSVSGPLAVGGAIFSIGTLTARNCTISGNSIVATSSVTKFAEAVGGGIAHTGRGLLTLQNSTVTGNIVSAVSTGQTPLAIAGGVFSFAAYIENSNISGNTVSATGGTKGCYSFSGGLFSGYLKLQGSTVSGNTVTAQSNATYCAASGGGIGGGGFYFYFGRAHNQIQNSTVSGNSVSAVGTYGRSQAAGIEAGKYLYLANSTVVYNSVKNATGKGGGIYFSGSYKNSYAKIVSSIIAKNSHNSAAPANDDIFSPTPYLGGTNNIVGDGTGQSTLINGSNANQVGGNTLPPIDPKISGLKNHGGVGPTHILLPGSPALDKGINTADIITGAPALSTDQRGAGFPRQIGPAVDIGATEFEAVPPTAVLSSAPNVTAAASTYTFTVTFTDNIAIDLLSLTNTNILVTGPNGFSQLATFVSATPNVDGPSIVATYKITPPGGTWDSTDDGTYTIAILPNQVVDTSNNAVAAATLGSFTVKVVTIASALTAIPNPAIVGQEVQFLVQAQGNPPLNFIWDFGDGTSAVGPNPIHIYSAVGTYTVLLTVVDASNATVTATISVVIIEANGDSDGDGFSNAVEVSLLSDPTSALSTPFNLPPPKAGGPVKTLRAKVQLSFGAPRQDQIFVSGFLPVPSGFQINGQIVIADIGNVVRAFVLDQSGNARVSTAPNSSPNDILRVRASKGGVRKFQLTIGHGTFQKIFANEPSVAQDLTNEKAGTFTKTVRVAIYFNGSKYESLINGTFRVNRHKLVGIFGK